MLQQWDASLDTSLRLKAGVAHMLHAPKCEGGLASFSFVSLALQSTSTELLMRLLPNGVEGQVCRARYVAARANHDWLTDGKTRAGPRFHFIRTCAARLRHMGYILSDVDSSHAFHKSKFIRLESSSTLYERGAISANAITEELKIGPRL